MNAKELYERILGYSSPIDVIFGKLQTEVEEDVLKAVQKIGIDVDKEELLKALKYDRDQYTRGYSCGIYNGYTRGRKETAKEIFTKIIENIDFAQRGLQSDDDKEWYRNKLYYKGLCWARRIVINIMKEFGVEVEE